MQDQFRRIWRHAASPVSIITTALDSQLAGMTISSLTSVSMGPPHMIVSFNYQSPSRTARLLHKRNSLVLNMLSATPSNVMLAREFAGRGGGHDVNPFKGHPQLFDTPSETDGIPVIREAAAQLLCDVLQVVPVQDHEIVLARVQDMWLGKHRPLVYREHKFWGVGDEVTGVDEFTANLLAQKTE